MSARMDVFFYKATVTAKECALLYNIIKFIKDELYRKKLTFYFIVQITFSINFQDQNFFISAVFQQCMFISAVFRQNEDIIMF